MKVCWYSCCAKTFRIWRGRPYRDLSVQRIVNPFESSIDPPALSKLLLGSKFAVCSSVVLWNCLAKGSFNVCENEVLIGYMPTNPENQKNFLFQEWQEMSTSTTMETEVPTTHYWTWIPKRANFAWVMNCLRSPCESKHLFDILGSDSLFGSVQQLSRDTQCLLAWRTNGGATRYSKMWLWWFTVWW